MKKILSISLFVIMILIINTNVASALNGTDIKNNKFEATPTPIGIGEHEPNDTYAEAYESENFPKGHESQSEYNNGTVYWDINGTLNSQTNGQWDYTDIITFVSGIQSGTKISLTMDASAPCMIMITRANGTQLRSFDREDITTVQREDWKNNITHFTTKLSVTMFYTEKILIRIAYTPTREIMTYRMGFTIAFDYNTYKRVSCILNAEEDHPVGEYTVGEEVNMAFYLSGVFSVHFNCDVYFLFIQHNDFIDDDVLSFVINDSGQIVLERGVMPIVTSFDIQNTYGNFPPMVFNDVGEYEFIIFITSPSPIPGMPYEQNLGAGEIASKTIVVQ